MWFFVDESWAPPHHGPQFGVLLGILVEHDKLERLERLLFAVRRKYFGSEHARDLTRDIKGKDLLSNYTLRLRAKQKSLPKNLCVVKEILTYPQLNADFYLRVFASTVYSLTARKPDLLSPDPKRLAQPFRQLVENVSAAALEHDRTRSVTLVFDQRLGAQQGLAISLRRFIKGMQLPNIHPYPYFAVSNVSPGVQVADVFAHLLSKRVQKKQEVMDLFREMMKLQWVSRSSPTRFGCARFEERIQGVDRKYRLRRKW